MFKVRVFRTIGKRMEERSGEARSISALRYATLNLLGILGTNVPDWDLLFDGIQEKLLNGITAFDVLVDDTRISISTQEVLKCQNLQNN